MSRPGDIGYTLTCYLTDDSAVKRTRSVPFDSRLLDLIDLGLKVGRCRGEDPCGRQNGYFHPAGECYWLNRLEELVSELDGVESPRPMS